MSIRRAAETDRERWLELRAALFPRLPLDRHDAVIGRVLASGARCAGLLFVPPGGGAATGLLEVARDAEDGSVARVEALYVVPGARRAGVARALLDEAGNWAARAGCKTLRCHWPLDDESAHAGLRALGFSERSREVHYTRTLHPALALGGASPRTPAVARADTTASVTGTRGETRPLLHGLIILAGATSLLMTDIFSKDVLRGAILPLLDVLFVIYVVALIAGRQYRRRTDARERSARLFETPPPAARRDRVE